MGDDAGMALVDRLQDDLTAAMKARDTTTVSTLRMAISAVKEAAVAGNSATELSDADVEAVLRTQVKRREEAAEAFDAGGRPAQAAAERAERDVLLAYLPQPLDLEELELLVSSTLGAGGYSDLAQLGQAMKAVMAEVAGRADGKTVSAMVKRALGG